MTKQSQEANTNSTAIQSGRDTVIQTGVSPAQMAEIIDKLGSFAIVAAQTARETADRRIAEFREELLLKFVNTEETDREAFKDPDFQEALRHAQESYARSGDLIVRDNLVDLIGRRSKELSRSRTSLTLNEALASAATLTANEFAELSFVYWCRYVRVGNITSPEILAEQMKSHLGPLLPDISRSQGSYQYLEAKSCATISIASMSLREKLVRCYAGVLTLGFSKSDVAGFLPEGKKDLANRIGFLIPCVNNAEKFQLRAINRETFKETEAGSGLTEPEMDSIFNQVEARVGDDNEIIKLLKPHFPEIDQVFRLWADTPACHLNLSSVGIAIGHANLVRLGKFQADLAIWMA